MDAKFRVPMTLMLLGSASCIILIVGFALGGALASMPAGILTVIFAAAGGLILASGAS